MGKTKALEIQGSSNVGLYGYATDSYCLAGKNLSEGDVKVFETCLEVPIHQITIGESSQVGVYANGNNSCLVVPDILSIAEKEALDALNITYAVIETKETALGNNLVVNDSFFFYHPDFEESAVRALTKALGVEGMKLDLEDWEVIGSIAGVTSQGGLVQNDVDDSVVSLLTEKMGVEFERGTLNFGSRVISGCLVVNKNGMVIGKASAGIEITNADMAFGFLEK